jgi:hypothetical protein
VNAVRAVATTGQLVCATANRPIGNLPRIAASRKQYWRFSDGVRYWMDKIHNTTPKEKRHATVYRQI